MVNQQVVWLGVACVAVAGVAVAGYTMTREEKPQASLATSNVAEERCIPIESRDEKRIAGTVIGAVVGGAVGRDVGDRDITTAAGAAAGAIVGNQAQKKFQDNRDGC